MQTLSQNVKQAFVSAGVTLTPAQEHVAASATSIDWLSVLKTLGQIAVKVIPLIIAILGGQTPPAPTPAQAQAGAACPCDHHACCLKTFESAIHTAKLAGEHLCNCCCG